MTTEDPASLKNEAPEQSQHSTETDAQTCLDGLRVGDTVELSYSPDSVFEREHATGTIVATEESIDERRELWAVEIDVDGVEGSWRVSSGGHVVGPSPRADDLITTVGYFATVEVEGGDA